MILRQWAGAAAAFVAKVVVDPVRNGRLSPGQWHPALRLLGATTLVTILASLAHVIAAQDMRAGGDLVTVGPDMYLPAAGMPVVAVGIFLALTLLQTAALHVSLPLRVVALTAGAATTIASLSQTNGEVPVFWVGAGAFVALVLFHLVRIGRRFSTFELAVVSVLVFCSTQLGMLDTGQALELGFETRGMILTTQMQYVWMLAVPALVAAGTALTQVAVTSGEAVGAIATRRLGVRSLTALLGVLVAWRSWVALSEFADGVPERWVPDLVGTLLALLVALAVAVPFVVRAHRRPGHERAEAGALADVFGGVSYLLVALSTLWLVLPQSLQGVSALLLRFGLQSPEWLWSLTGLVNHALTPSVSRIAAGALCLLLAWRWAGRGQWLGALLVAAFLGPQVVFLWATLQPEAPVGFSNAAMGLWLLLALLVAMGVVAGSGRADRARVGALLAAAAIMTLHDFRHVLENPMAAVIGFSALASILFGITWRILTDGEFTRGDSRAFPRSTRVLLYLANVAFVTTVVTFSALTRDATGFFDISIWEELGDQVFAYPLLFSAVLVALFIAVSGPRRALAPQSSSMTSSVRSSSDSSTRV